jgi:hypothetical protein
MSKKFQHSSKPSTLAAIENGKAELTDIVTELVQATK